MTLRAADGEDIACHVNGQDWLVSWHGPESVPAGTRHGSAGICVTNGGELVLVSADAERWELPAGRPEGAETWEETLRREVLEEACATVGAARLLGFSRGRCTRGHEAGLVLVRSIWFAHVVLASWTPMFEIKYRKVLPVGELFAHLAIEDGYLPIYRRALHEAGIG
jgi:8-oxo-dGTP pyrophosphatase MutT (NUDIX family)